MFKSIVAMGVLALMLNGCSKNSASVQSQNPGTASASQSGSGNIGGGSFTTKVPAGWVSEKPSSDMRLAQFKLPKAGNDSEDALLVLYFFGKGQGGTPEANIERWVNQVKQPDGSDSKDKARIGKLTVNGLQVNTVDVSGNYSGGMSADSAPHDSKSIYRLRGAIVETPGGSYFVKLTGPENTVNHWDQAYNDYLNSFQFK